MRTTDVTRPDAPGAAEPETLHLRRATGRSEYPLSFNQREMWVLCQLHGETGLHNIAVEVALAGPLDHGAFRAAFQSVVDRHEAMRTAFPTQADGVPVQRVEAVRADIAVRDLSALPPEQQAIQVRARAEALVRQPFALDRAPLFRAELVRLAPERAVFVFVFHNLILDGFYLPQWLEELARAYERRQAGDERTPPPPALQFGDFAIHEERKFQAGLLAPLEGHWRAQLQTPLPAMAMTVDRAAPPIRTFENLGVPRRLPADLSAAIAALAQRCGTTTFRIVTAAFQALFWRLTGETDLLFATPFSTRPDAMRDTIGFFGNTLPLRVGLDPDRPFNRLLGDVTRAVRDARERREFPLTELLRTLDQRRDPHRPLMPVCVAQVRPFDSTAAGLSLRVTTLLTGGTTFDLSLLIGDEERAIDLRLVYASELFREETIHACLEALQTLLASIVANPEQPVRALALLSDAERQRVAQWGSGDAWHGRTPPPAAEDAVGRSVAQDLRARAAAQPGAIAVEAGETTWTYARLQGAADRIAAALRDNGVGRETRVGLFGARSPGMLATAIGVLNAGAAFVSLEGSQPEARLLTIAQAAAISTIVCDRASLSRVRALLAQVDPDRRPLCWDDVIADDGTADNGTASGGGRPLQEGPVSSDPEALAYIFYTSGSTGTPKGAMVEQRGLRNHLRAKIAALDLDASCRVVQNASYGFDIIVWQWLAPLLAGGRVLIYDEATAEDPLALMAAMSRDAATVMETVPSFLEAMLEAAEARPLPLPSLRWLVSNAEILPPAVARRWLERYPDSRLMNAYGPTECSDDTMHADVRLRDLPETLARVTIGHPIPGSTVAVVDELLRPLPPGGVGEIVIGGVVVGRGYLGDPVTTARAFAPDPRGATAGARLYRTGDRGRWRADGELECLGRKDDQVRLHGYRVELGDVEAALARLPELSQVAAAVRTDARGQRRLVAYYVAPAACDVTAVRAALAARLPAFMVPNAIVRLPAMPRTRTGKLDRAALPAPPQTESLSSEPAATPLEAQIAEIWQQVLNVGAVGRHENFFDLGGDSIQCIRVVARLNQRGVPLSPRAVFAHQTVAELAHAIGGLTDRAARDAVSAPAAEEPVPPAWLRDHAAHLPADAEDVYPLAPIQEGMLFHAVLEPESSLYYEQDHFALDGPLDLDAWRRAWDHLAASHPILRTVIRWDGLPEPVQVVRAARPIAMRVVDVASQAPDEQARVIAREAEEDWRRRFVLDEGPLLRLMVCALGQERFRFVWTFHHILLDGWSGTSLLRDLARAYEAISGGQPPPIARVRPYRDFVGWLGARDRAEATAYWQRELAGFDAPTPLPRDRQPGPVRRRDHDQVDASLAPEILAALTRWTRAERVTMSALLRAAWAVVLGRLTDTRDVLFGATVSGRPPDLDHVEQIVGPFINAVPVRVALDRVDTVADLVRRVHAQAVEAGAFEYLPLTDVQKVSAIPASRPLFESLLAYENFPIEDRPPAFGCVAMRVLHSRELTHYDLTLYVTPSETLRLRLAYATDVIERDTALRIVRAAASLLTALAADPRLRIAEAPLLAPEDEARVLAWGRATTVPAIDGASASASAGAGTDSVHASLAATFTRRSEATAIVAADGACWTYARLDHAAAHIAAALARAGVTREHRVGLLGTRSPGMLAAVIAVIRCGAVFVPLESQQPDARLHAILAATGLSVIVCDRGARARAERLALEQTPAPVCLCWDTLTVAASERAVEIVAAAQRSIEEMRRERPSDLAYIFFTSGSTGTPKGVMVEQRAMHNHLRAKIATLGLDESCRVVQNAAAGFDIIVWQWLAPLLAGGRVLVYDDATAEDPAALISAMARDGATVVETVPSFLEAIVEEAESPAAPPLRALRWMVSNAEALPPAVARRWMACHPTVRLLNTYGATECADDTTHGDVVTPGAADERVPVGRAIPGVTVAVVDAALRPVPPGCPGEIVLGGIAVGRGYLGDPVTTARAFVPDPRADAQGARLYRTGDRGRWTTAGTLECLGRTDDQVKVRGFRVELGEVEAALAALPALSQVAAAVRPDEQGRPSLVAYYVARESCDRAALRTALASRLPRYMVPEAFVRLDALPRTLTGKLDRAALPSPPPPEHAAAGAADAPATPLESTIAGVWQQVLQVPRVGRHDNFFDLGGHSLTAIRIIAALKGPLGRRVPIRALFSSPTVAEFAAAIGDAPPQAAPPADARSAPAAAVEPSAAMPPPTAPHAPVPSSAPSAGRRPCYPLSAAQRAQWITQQMSAGEEWYSPRVLALDGPFERALFADALQALVDRHDALRTSFAERDGDVVQIVADRYELPWRFEDLSTLPPDARPARVRQALEEESRRPFQLLRLPLLELRLLRLEPERHLLIFRLPHIVTDGWTEGILVTDLAELYNARRAGRAASLPALALRHVDLCVHERDWLETAPLAAQKAYWLERFDAHIPALRLPPAPAGRQDGEHRTAFATALVEPAVFAALRDLAARQGVTPFVVLLSLFDVLLARLAGQSDFVVSTPIAGRGRAELERIAGLFANLLPLRADLSGNPSFLDILARVSETTVAGLTHQEYPFHRWVEALRHPASHRARLFSAFFVVHEEAFQPAFDGLSTRWFSSETFGTSLFSRALPWYPQGIAFYGHDAGSGWRVSLLGDASTFDEPTLQRMLTHWHDIVRQVIADPSRRLAAIELPAASAAAHARSATVVLDRDEIDQLFA